MKKILFLLFLFASCGSNKLKIPDTVLQQEKLVKVLTEIHLQEAKLNMSILQGENPYKDTVEFADIFKDNNITKAQFDSTMSFYTAHPEMLDVIYDEVISELNKMKSLQENKK